MSRLTSPSEWVAPLAPIVSLAILPLGPILFPRAYLVILFTYFVVFLYSQVNHLCKFFITARRMHRVIRKWNFRLGSVSDGVTSVDRQEEKSGLLIVRTREDTTASSSSRADSPNFTRDRTPLIDNRNSLQSDFADIEEKLQYYEDPTYMHAFIIPNYYEPEGLLRDTIDRLASHRNARTHYIIILAMEAAEPDYEEKGHRLQEFFKERFAHFIVTGHPPDIPGESRGKGSNVAYAARHGCAELMKRGVDKSRVILTVTDSDSAIPELYVREMEDALYKAEDPYHLLFAPPIFFSRNCFEVPAAVRVTDITWSAMVMSNLSNSAGLSFPCSTYSLSLVLAERVGYWDTDADSVGEDMHMFLKCFFKTDGLARTVPIYVPINLTNVQTNGYFSNMNARYVQAKRHYNGVADVAYTLRHAFRLSGYPLVNKQAVSRSYLAKLTVCLKVLEAHMIPVTSGWLMFAALPLMQFILFPPHAMVALVSPADNPILTSEFYATLWNITKIITIFLPLPLFGTLAIYEHVHRTIDRDLLQKSKADTRQWKNLLDYVTLPIAAWLFMTLPSTLACFKRLRMREEQYIVAEKVFKNENRLAAKIEELAV